MEYREHQEKAEIYANGQVMGSEGRDVPYYRTSKGGKKVDFGSERTVEKKKKRYTAMRKEREKERKRESEKETNTHTKRERNRERHPETEKVFALGFPKKRAEHIDFTKKAIEELLVLDYA